MKIKEGKLFLFLKRGGEKVKRFLTSKKGRLILLGGGVLFILFGGFLAFSFRRVYRQGKELSFLLQETKNALKARDLSLLKKQLEATEVSLEELTKEYRLFGWMKFVPVIKEYYLDGQRGILAIQEGVAAGKIVVEAVEPYQDFLGLGEKTGGGEQTTKDRIEFLVTTLDSLKPKLDLLEKKLSRIEDLTAKIDPYRYPEEIKGKKIREKLILGKEQIKEIALLFREGKPLLEKMPYLLGKDETRKYLLIFQNDGELRPTGGFWTAYGILAVDNGKITPLVSEDMYALDKRFNSSIPAPEPIKKYLKNVYYWHLRDMNLSPDFRLSLEQFLPLYQKVAREKKVDGVVAVDTQVLVSLLKVLGRVGVPGWGNFSADPDKRCFGAPQVVCQLEFLADKPLTEIKENRKGFIGPIMHSILANAMGAPRSQIPALAQAFFDNLSSKHLLFYFPDEKLQKAIEKLGYGGRIKDFSEDYFHLNDANFGGAKSNLFITQEVVHEYKVLPDGRIKKKVIVKYQNTAPASDCNLERGNLCLNGLYRDWFRFYLPEGSQFEKLVGSEPKAKVYRELGKTVVEGFFGDRFPLYPKGISKVSLEYILPFKKKKHFSLLIQKQPGKKTVKHIIRVNGKTQKEIEVNGDIIAEVNLP
ncbi:DUF4012 domain-containing protein [bacterium]|nr:DUF4012 domain-containing protein [bacterium]